MYDLILKASGTKVAVLLDDEQQAVKLLEAGAQKIREACQELHSFTLTSEVSYGSVICHVYCSNNV